MKIPFTKKTDKERQESVEIIPVEETTQLVAPEKTTLLDKINSLEENLNKLGISLKAERNENIQVREEIIPPVITIGTDLDIVDPLTGQITQKTDKWGFHIDYHGTKGRIWDNEIPMFQFGHLGAIMPNLRNKVYKYTYEYDKEGNLKRDESGNPIVLKKERVHLAVELTNLKARLNLAENGYARKEQKDVIIGGVGQVDPYTGDKITQLLDWGFGGGKKK